LSLLRSEIVFQILKRETKSINTEKSQLLCIESNTLKNFVTNQESIKKFFAIFYGFDKKRDKISEKYSKSKSSFAMHIILKKKNYNTSQSIKENIFLLPNVKFIFVMLNEKRINVVFVI